MLIILLKNLDFRIFQSQFSRFQYLAPLLPDTLNLTPSRTPHGLRSLNLISNHAKRFEAFVLGIEDDHSTLEIAVDALKPG